jgi:hypothetical protein
MIKGIEMTGEIEMTGGIETIEGIEMSGLEEVARGKTAAEVRCQRDTRPLELSLTNYPTIHLKNVYMKSCRNQAK